MFYIIVRVIFLHIRLIYVVKNLHYNYLSHLTHTFLLEFMATKLKKLKVYIGKVAKKIIKINFL